MPNFDFSNFQFSDKSVAIDGPDGFRILVDYDDVPHAVIDELMPVVIEALKNIPEAEWNNAVSRGQAQEHQDELEEFGDYEYPE